MESLESLAHFHIHPAIGVLIFFWLFMGIFYFLNNGFKNKSFGQAVFIIILCLPAIILLSPVLVLIGGLLISDFTINYIMGKLENIGKYKEEEEEEEEGIS